MGLYDSLIIEKFKCPHCKHVNKAFELQTKAGDCAMEVFHIGDIFPAYHRLRSAPVIGGCEECDCYFRGFMNLDRLGKILNVELYSMNVEIDIKLQ